ncbi:hypothetical protein [Armatimonas sp.]|uniref:hypothetical protein n=1 Tax=Armatimonas sp. TaxID=1872638 RepID=UPI0037509317
MVVAEMAGTIKEIVWHETLTDVEFDTLFKLYNGTFQIMATHPKLIRFDNAIVEIMDLLNDSNNNTPLSEKDMVILIYISAVMNGLLTVTNIQSAATTLGINSTSYIATLISKVVLLLASVNSKHQQGITKVNQYKQVAPMRLHYFYRKGLTKTYVFTGSSGSPNITVCCPMPKKQELYFGTTLKQIYQTMIFKFKKIMYDIPDGSGGLTKAGVLRISLPIPNTLKIGYIHYDTQNFLNGAPIIGKQDEYDIYVAMIKNPELINVLFNDLVSSNQVCVMTPSTGLPSNAREIPSMLVFNMTNGWETFQVTSVIEQTSCPLGYTYQICHKAGFTINGANASLAVLDGSGWCGV